jgi:hypothetical protein
MALFSEFSCDGRSFASGVCYEDRCRSSRRDVRFRQPGASISTRREPRKTERFTSHLHHTSPTSAKRTSVRPPVFPFTRFAMLEPGHFGPRFTAPRRKEDRAHHLQNMATRRKRHVPDSPLGFRPPLSYRDKEKLMNARKVAAQFAAYVWYENIQRTERSEDEKARFARGNWRPFLPIAPEGLGRLLIKIAAGRSRRHRREPGRASILHGRSPSGSASWKVT